MTDIKFLGEEDYLSCMENENKAWFDSEVTSDMEKYMDGVTFYLDGI